MQEQETSGETLLWLESCENGCKSPNILLVMESLISSSTFSSTALGICLWAALLNHYDALLYSSALPKQALPAPQDNPHAPWVPNKRVKKWSDVGIEEYRLLIDKNLKRMSSNCLNVSVPASFSINSFLDLTQKTNKFVELRKKHKQKSAHKQLSEIRS